MKIVLVTGLWGKKNYTKFKIASKLINLLNPLSNEITWVVTNPFNDFPLDDKVRLIRIENKYQEKPFLKSLLYFLLHQVKIMIIMLKMIMLKRYTVLQL